MPDDFNTLFSFTGVHYKSPVIYQLPNSGRPNVLSLHDAFWVNIINTPEVPKSD